MAPRTDTAYRPLTSLRSRLAVRGPDRKRFLHGMLTNDINGLREGQGCHAALLTVKGKLQGDMTVYDAPEELLLELEAGLGPRVAAALERHLIMEDAEVRDRSAELHELGVYGAGAAAALAELLGLDVSAAAGLAPYQHLPAPGARVAATAELAWPGFRVLGAPAALEALEAGLARLGVPLLGEEDAEVLRVEAGVPRFGLDMDEERFPIEANLDHAVSYSKGCYLGQEPIARLAARGHVNRRLQGLRLQLPPDAPLPPRGAALHHPSREGAGALTTVVRSPRLGPIALGYVHRSCLDAGTVLQLADGAGEAVVTPLPFPRAP